MRSRINIKSGRPAFTLIEMIVVISIIIVLATLSVAIIPSVQQRTKAARAADQVQGWSLISREWALRAGTPHGVRLLVDLDARYGWVCRSLLYIEQPEPFTGGLLQFDNPNQVTPAPNPYKASFIGVDITGGFAAQALWLVQIGDYLQVQGGQSHYITGVFPPDPVAGTPAYVTTLTRLWDAVNLPEALATSVPPYSTSAYLITRSPRPVADQQPLNLPDDVVIDMNTPNVPNNIIGSVPDWTWGTLDTTTLVPGQQRFYDLLFTPSGALTGSIGTANGKIILWLRDVTKDYPLPPNPQNDTGEQHLLVIYSRTGRIGSVPFNSDPNIPSPGNYDPYFYVYDPRNSGL